MPGQKRISSNYKEPAADSVIGYKLTSSFGFDELGIYTQTGTFHNKPLLHHISKNYEIFWSDTDTCFAIGPNHLDEGNFDLSKAPPDITGVYASYNHPEETATLTYGRFET